ncbi:EF-hand calcium-binding domain-containing protein 7-like [Anneissia japonica]|uniref:EF-hand calcium-binding domain-containing protein 7-like n=1 Tax=Anneissia japonica TaxID=1529436 RepID=UPI001425A536|nr:EF-hand calcium-binding domain-containing protein 7-like [Anneissia japonica]XP_033117525.1 EF-hand calcium-binding domain-containing protein 7-like [Anneissia japonica]
MSTRRQSASNFGSSDTDEKSIEDECLMTYKLIIGNIKDNIKSKDQLIQMLHHAGRNPSQKNLKSYWKDSTNSLTFQDFCKIMKEEKVPTEKDLQKAFKKIDVNGDGFITFKELKKVLTARGEKMSESEVKSMINEVDDNGDGKLDYTEFCKMLFSTVEQCKKKGTDKLNRRERRPKESKSRNESSRRGSSKGDTKQEKRSSSTESKSKKRDTSSANSKPKKSEPMKINLPAVVHVAPRVTEPRTLKSWHHAFSKGCFHLEENGVVISHQYLLELPTTTNIWMTIKPCILRPDQKHFDMHLFILKQNEDGTLGDYVGYTHLKNQQKFCLNKSFKEGSYRLIPFTTGCLFKPRTRKVKDKAKLVEQSGEEYLLTKAFKDALTDVFELIDLDCNGLLSREEFSLFQLRTSGEAVDDDAWEVVEENFELKKGEITKKGFMELNQMEANDEEGDTEDLWVTLNSMGFADDLRLDEASPFRVDIYSEKCRGRLKVLQLQSGGRALEKAVCASVKATEDIQINKLSKDLNALYYTGDSRVTVVIDNQTNSRAVVKLDCGKSQNCISNVDDMERTVQIPPMSMKVGLHLLPKDEEEDWTIKCHETVN